MMFVISGQLCHLSPSFAAERWGMGGVPRGLEPGNEAGPVGCSLRAVG